MQGLEPSLDLSPLLGRQLLQLCFGAWNVALVFDGEVRIVVESAIAVTSEDSSITTVEDFRDGATLLCRAIGLELVDAARMSDGGLEIRFSSGLRWVIENSVRDYESFQLHVGTSVFVA
jgi:hypothetical protein